MPSARSTLRRVPERGGHDPALVHAILDEAWVAHVAVDDDGPVVVPMAFVRDGDRMLLHGSVHSRVMRALAAGRPCCASVTLLDALVFAKSQFHHSMNFRSVVLFGEARPVPDEEKAETLLRFVDRVAPGRSKESRPASDAELKATMVVFLPLDEATTKVREGPPADDARDQDLPHWSGLVPLAQGLGAPVTHDGGEPPASIRRLVG